MPNSGSRRITWLLNVRRAMATTIMMVSASSSPKLIRRCFTGCATARCGSPAEPVHDGLHAVARQVQAHEEAHAEQSTVFAYHQVVQEFLDEVIDLQGKHVAEVAHQLLLEILHGDVGDEREQQDDGGEEGEEELERYSRGAGDEAAFGERQERNAISGRC